MRKKKETDKGIQEKTPPIKKSGWLSTLLLVLLVMGGLGMMLYPKISDTYQRWLLSQEVAEYNRSINSLIEDDQTRSEFWMKADEYNRAIRQKDTPLIATDEEKEYLKTQLNPIGNGMIGTLSIPAIDVEIPVYQGTEEDSLQSGAGWWIGSSFPVGGESTHAVITAHTGLVKAELFTNLDKLKEGDFFSFRVLDRNLYYVVDQILVTVPEDTAPLTVQEGEDWITLYTCTPYGINTHRLLVRGHRIEEPEIPVASIVKGKLMNWWWLALLLLPLLLLPLLRRRKQVVVPMVESEQPQWPGLIRQVPMERRPSKGHKKTVLRRASNTPPQHHPRPTDRKPTGESPRKK